jgi:hypothetical protein
MVLLTRQAKHGTGERKMARLIDVEPIIDECKECMSIEWNRNVYTTWAEAEEDFRNRLEDAPTVDAVPVVRCKDCKHYREDSFWCDMNSKDRGEWFNWYPEDFCSYGERKE